MSDTVAVPSVFGRDFSFTVLGADALASARTFGSELEAALAAGTLGYLI